jgi:hypothetical protein
MHANWHGLYPTLRRIQKHITCAKILRFMMFNVAT